MKSFREFLSRTSKNFADYIPSHGSHSCEEKKVAKKNLADYTPSHGKHSQKESYEIDEAKAKELKSQRP